MNDLHIKSLLSYAGAAGASKLVFDSDDDDQLEMQETSTERRQKRKRSLVSSRSPPTVRASDATPPGPPSYGNNWQWVPTGQWMPPPTMAPPQWGMGMQPPPAPYPDRGMVLQPPPPHYADKWVGNPLGTAFTASGDLSTDATGRASRRVKQSADVKGRSDRSTVGKKPHNITVNDLGEIDPGCAGKNAWDSSVRAYVPRILDMSIIDWEKQKPQSVQKLRDALDKDFEYLGNDLSMLGFRNAIKRYLKTERSRLKAHFLLGGEDDCPSHVNPDQWARLQEYWGTDKQVKKAATMANARRQVKNYSSVGRKGKGAKEVQMVRDEVLCRSMG